MIEIGRKILSDADFKYVLSTNERSGDDGQILISKEICDKLDWNWTKVSFSKNILEAQIYLVSLSLDRQLELLNHKADSDTKSNLFKFSITTKESIFY